MNAQDLAGNAVATIMLEYDIYRGTIYYVNASRPDDTGDGLSVSTARKFIHAAVADALVPATILVAEGEYRLSNDLSTHIVLREGVSLYGGYSSDFLSRAPATSISTIEDRSTSNNPASFDSPHRAIEGTNNSSNITSETVIDGFTIYGSPLSGPDYTAAIFLINALPTIQNNTINGGGGSFFSYGIYSWASPTVQNNTIHGGNGGTGSFGIINRSNAIVRNNTIYGGSGDSSHGISHLYGSATAQNNTIHGGDGTSSYGITNSNTATPVIRSNTIHGGSGSNTSYGISSNDAAPRVLNNTIYGGSGGNASYGMRNDSSSPFVQNNTIHGGNSINAAYSIYNGASSSPEINNNIFLSRSGVNAYCFSEDLVNAVSDPVSLKNNVFSGCAILYYDFDNGCSSGTDCTRISQVNVLAGISGGASDNVATDPLFVDIDGADDDINTMDDNDWHYSVASPVSITEGGLNGIDENWGFNTDKDEVNRPASGNPWSIGAYEP